MGRSSMEETVVVRSSQLPEVQTAYLKNEGKEGKKIEGNHTDKIFYKREKAPPLPPPRRVSLLKYEEQQ